MTIDLEDPSKARLGKLKESSLSQQNATPSPPPASSSLFPSLSPDKGPKSGRGAQGSAHETYHKDFCALQVHLHPQGKAKHYLWQAEQWPPKDICRIWNVNVTLF